MTYSKLLPGEPSLLRLARLVEFPATREDIAYVAKQACFPRSVVEFLALFSDEDLFENGVDFMNQCEEVKMLIRQQRKTPKEFVYSQQD